MYANTEITYFIFLVMQQFFPSERRRLPRVPASSVPGRFIPAPGTAMWSRENGERSSAPPLRLRRRWCSGIPRAFVWEELEKESENMRISAKNKRRGVLHRGACSTGPYPVESWSVVLRHKGEHTVVRCDERVSVERIHRGVEVAVGAEVPRRPLLTDHSTRSVALMKPLPSVSPQSKAFYVSGNACSNAQRYAGP